MSYDLTLRGLFRGARQGHDEWNDTRDYREKYGVVRGNPLTERSKFLDFAIPGLPTHTTPIHRKDDDDFYYLYVVPTLIAIVPESEIVKDEFMHMTYGQADNGTCDKCGVDLHALNKTPYYLCMECSEELKRGYEDDNIW